MILTTFDVDQEIDNRTVFLKLAHTDLGTGMVDWDAYEKERKEIVDAAWQRQREIMKMEIDSMIKDVEAQVDSDLLYAEYMCSKHSRSSNFPAWVIPLIVFFALYCTLMR